MERKLNNVLTSVDVENEQKKSKRSATYSIRALGEHAASLIEEGLMSEEDEKTIKEIRKRTLEKYCGL